MRATTRYYSPNKDLNALAREAVRQGWTVERTGSNHLRWTAPSGSFFFSASTPSNPWRTITNLRADMRRALRRNSPQEVTPEG